MKRQTAYFQTVHRVNLCDNDNYDNSVVHDYDVELMLRHIKSTAPGIDELPAWLFRLCSFEIAAVIAGILDLSVSTGNVRDNWLCAMVTAVPKIKNLQQFADFRPISVTTIISRVAERLVVSRWLRPAIPCENLSDRLLSSPLVVPPMH